MTCTDAASSLDAVHADVMSMRPGEIIEAADAIGALADGINALPATEMVLLLPKLVRLRRVLGLAERMFGQIAEQFSQDQASTAAPAVRLEIEA